MVTKVPEDLQQWLCLAKKITEKLDVDYRVLLALIWKECEQDLNNPCLTRFEKYYQYFWHPTKKALWRGNLSRKQNREIAENLLGHEEFIFQSTSWGLCQLMGAVARELGYAGSPKSLCDPDVNIFIGCLHLSNILKRAHGDYKMALTRYNNSVEYAVEVLRRTAILEEEWEI